MANQWERIEGNGQAITVSELIEKLLQVQRTSPDMPVRFRNYLEENVLASLTDVTLDNGSVVFESNDLPIAERI